jgi:ammonia channel protein AmtB
MYAAFVIGLLGGAAYLAGLRLLRLLQVDDPVHVAAVHLLPGIWGAIAPGIFATPVRHKAASAAELS